MKPSDIDYLTAWIETLRANPGKQLHGRMKDDAGNFCALGAALSLNPEEFTQDGRYLYQKALHAIGLRADYVSSWNDSYETFAEIANRLEAALTAAIEQNASRDARVKLY